MTSATSRSGPFSWREIGALAAIIVIWGVNNAGAKVATAVLPPLFVGGLRFLLTLICLAPLLLRPPLPDIRKLFGFMVLAGPLHFSLIYLGFALGKQLSPLAIAGQLWIPFTALFAWLMLGERMTRLAGVGLAIAFAGVAWMSLDPEATGELPAILITALAAAVWALATVLVRRIRGVAPLKLNALTAAVATPVLLGAAFATEPHLLEKVRGASLLVWACVAWAGLMSSIVATTLLYWLVQRREAARVTPYLLLSTIVSCAIGVGLMGDRVTPALVLGALLAMGGIVLVTFAERRQARAATEAAAVEPPI
jgi:O-acetylserine/cysteine efflux transporter